MDHAYRSMSQNKKQDLKDCNPVVDTLQAVDENIKKETNVKRIILKITKRFFISIAIILALMVILGIGTYLYNKASLKKEATNIVYTDVD